MQERPIKLVSNRRKPYVPVIGFKIFASHTPNFLNGGPLKFGWVRNRAVCPAHIPFAAALYQHGGAVVPERVFAACRFFNRPIIKHWVGTDVLRAALPLVPAQHATGQIVHWANAPWLAAELARVGISAHVVPNTYTEGTVLPMPPAPLTVLTYLPQFEFYGGPQVIAIARSGARAR